MSRLSKMIQALHPVAPGQVEFTTDSIFIVPPGVFSVSAVCMQRGTVAGEAWAGVPAARIVRAGLDVVRAQNGNRLGDGGGDGGMSGSHVPYTVPESPYNQAGGGGGGGGGGYAGDGGPGGDFHVTNGPWVGAAAVANSGGGGGGMSGANSYPPAGGGGVGLEGIGPTGGGVNTWPSTAKPGSYGDPGAMPPNSKSQTTGSNGGLYGGAQGDMRTGAAYGRRGRGGANAWKNNIAVYPGEVLQVFVAGNGGVRIMWGGERSYPSNAAGIWPAGWFRSYRIYITAVAAGVAAIGEIELRASVGGADITTPGSVCAASSQYDGTTTANKVVDNAGRAFASCWMAPGGAAGVPPQWLSIRPSMAVVQVAELAMWPATGYETWAPSSFVVQGSMNGAAWTDIKAFSGVTGWAANTPKTFSLI